MTSRFLLSMFVLLAQGVTSEPTKAQTTRIVSHATPHRYLDEVPGTNRYPWVVGKDWPRNTLVHLTVHFMGRTAQTTLRTGVDGRFGLGIQGVRWCTGLVIEAIDATTYRVVLHGASPFRLCPIVSGTEHMIVRPLTPREMSAREYFISGGRSTLLHRIRVGDMLYIYVHQKRLSLRRLDWRYFSVIEQGIIPDCPPNASCLFPPGVYYRVVAIRAGHAVLPIGEHQVARVEIMSRA